jgi:hypothetical protein
MIVAREEWSVSPGRGERFEAHGGSHGTSFRHDVLSPGRAVP